MLGSKGDNSFFLLFILFFSQSLLAQTNDPCNEITGKWKGTMNSGGCSWKLEATGSIYKDSIMLQMHRYHGRPWLDCVSENTFALPGVCKDGYITIKTSNRGIIEGPIQRKWGQA